MTKGAIAAAAAVAALLAGGVLAGWAGEGVPQEGRRGLPPTTTVWPSLEAICEGATPRPSNCPTGPIPGWAAARPGWVEDGLVPLEVEGTYLEPDGRMRVDCDSPAVLCDDEEA